MKKSTLLNKFEKSIDDVLEALYASRDILESAEDLVRRTSAAIYQAHSTAQYYHTVVSWLVPRH